MDFPELFFSDASSLREKGMEEFGFSALFWDKPRFFEGKSQKEFFPLQRDFLKSPQAPPLEGEGEEKIEEKRKDFAIKSLAQTPVFYFKNFLFFCNAFLFLLYGGFQKRGILQVSCFSPLRKNYFKLVCFPPPPKGGTIF